MRIFHVQILPICGHVRIAVVAGPSINSLAARRLAKADFPTASKAAANVGREKRADERSIEGPSRPDAHQPSVSCEDSPLLGRETHAVTALRIDPPCWADVSVMQRVRAGATAAPFHFRGRRCLALKPFRIQQEVGLPHCRCCLYLIAGSRTLTGPLYSSAFPLAWGQWPQTVAPPVCTVKSQNALTSETA